MDYVIVLLNQGTQDDRLIDGIMTNTFNKNYSKIRKKYNNSYEMILLINFMIYIYFI